MDISRTHQGTPVKSDYFDINASYDLFKAAIKSTLSQIKNKTSTHCMIYGPALILLFIASLISVQRNIPIANITRSLAITGGHPLLGVISNIGAILWSSSAAFCCLSHGLLKKRKDLRGELEFVMFGGFISTILLFDDLLMLHEQIFPNYIGVSERVTFFLYGLLIVLYLIRFSKLILKTEFIYLVFALFFFALSVMIDLMPDSILPMHYLFEDGTKLLGIVSWASYQYSICFRQIETLTETA